MNKLQNKIISNIKTVIIPFPYSLEFGEAFKEFEGKNIFEMADRKTNIEIKSLVKDIILDVENFAAQQKIPIVTDLDWRFEVEFTPDGLRVETLQPLFKVIGELKDTTKIVESHIPTLSRKYPFTKTYETLFNNASTWQDGRVSTDQNERKFLKELKAISMDLAS